MDLWTVIKVVFRRWYAVVPILALTAFLAYEIAYKAPPSYRASGSALLVAPNVTTGATGLPVKQNPYLLFSGSLNITASALVRVLNDTEVRGDLIDDGLRGDYEIGVEQSTPTIGVTATGPTPEVVVATARRILDEVERRLGGLQDAADAPSDLRIGTEFLVTPSSAETLRGEVARTMATIGVLGLLAGVALALLLEAAVVARRRSKADRRARRLAAEAEAEAGTGTGTGTGADATAAVTGAAAAEPEAAGAAVEDPAVPAAAEDPTVPAAAEDPAVPATDEDPAVPAADEDPAVPAAAEDPAVPAAAEAPDSTALDGSPPAIALKTRRRSRRAADPLPQEPVPAPGPPEAVAEADPKPAPDDTPPPPATRKRAPRRTVKSAPAALDTDAPPATNGSHPPAGEATETGAVPGDGQVPAADPDEPAASQEETAEPVAAGPARRIGRRKRSER